ncbi:MAG: hypothetical protein ACPGKS_07315 [Coraliomargarita sp.]
MFKRIAYDSWTEVIPSISFWLTFLVFMGIVVTTIFMKKQKVDRMGHMPLDDNENGNTSHNEQ